MSNISRIYMLTVFLISFFAYGMEDNELSVLQVKSSDDQQSAIIDPYGPKTYPPSSFMAHPAFMSYVIFREKESSYVILRRLQSHVSNVPLYGPVFTWSGQQQYPTDDTSLQQLLEDISSPEEPMGGWGEPWAANYKYHKDSQGAGTVGNYLTAVGKVITLYCRTLKGGIEDERISRLYFNKKNPGKIIIQDMSKLKVVDSSRFFLDTERNKVISMPEPFVRLFLKAGWKGLESIKSDLTWQDEELKD